MYVLKNSISENWNEPKEKKFINGNKIEIKNKKIANGLIKNL
jgi:hypothetical protein